MKYFIGSIVTITVLAIVYIGFGQYKNSSQTSTTPTVVQSVEDQKEQDPPTNNTSAIAGSISSTSTTTPPKVVAPTTTTLEETGSIGEGTNPMWWLNSGGYMFTTNGVSETIQGDLATTDKWFLAYKKSNPTDTDGGLHPQNIFRLVNKGTYENFQQQAYFKITKQNLSASDQRDAWSGLLLFNRYIDGDNLYYTGIRADGTAVIKSKKKGVYVTLAQATIFPGKYNRSTNPNLLPQNSWVGIRSELQTLPDGSVSIKLYVDNGKTGNWKLATSAIDTKDPILGGHHAGIRTDFMDVQFENYQIQSL